jgi:excisionase family DNA binding protein
MTKRGFTESEASEYCGISRSALRQARAEGVRVGRIHSPPFVKLGRSVRYLKEDLDRWLESRRIVHDPASPRKARR